MLDKLDKLIENSSNNIFAVITAVLVCFAVFLGYVIGQIVIYFL